MKSVELPIALLRHLWIIGLRTRLGEKEKEMTHPIVDTQALRKYDEKALGMLFRAIADLRGRRLSREEVFSIYDEGVVVVFAGHALNHAPELNYAIFYSKASNRLPVILTVKCFTARSQSHEEVIRYGDRERLIVAGTLRNRRFSSISTTWMKGIERDSGQYTLGMYLNDLLLDYYNIQREPTWASPIAQAWSLA